MFCVLNRVIEWTLLRIRFSQIASPATSHIQHVMLRSLYRFLLYWIVIASSWRAAQHRNTQGPELANSTRVEIIIVNSGITYGIFILNDTALSFFLIDSIGLFVYHKVNYIDCTMTNEKNCRYLLHWNRWTEQSQYSELSFIYRVDWPGYFCGCLLTL